MERAGVIRLLLVRHGETDWNRQRRYQGHSDVPLNEAGRQQAARLAIRLTAEPIDAIHTSDLSRARETAEIIGRALGVEVMPEPRLREMSFGIIEGLTYDEAQADYGTPMRAWLADANQPPEGGETLDAFTERVAALLAELRSCEDETLILVAHGGPLRELIRLCLGLPPEGRWYFTLDNASLTELLLYDGQPLLTRLNDTCHLSGNDNDR